MNYAWANSFRVFPGVDIFSQKKIKAKVKKLEFQVLFGLSWPRFLLGSQGSAMSTEKIGRNPGPKPLRAETREPKNLFFFVLQILEMTNDPQLPNPLGICLIPLMSWQESHNFDVSFQSNGRHEIHGKSLCQRLVKRRCRSHVRSYIEMWLRVTCLQSPFWGFLIRCFFSPSGRLAVFNCHVSRQLAYCWWRASCCACWFWYVSEDTRPATADCQLLWGWCLKPNSFWLRATIKSDDGQVLVKCLGLVAHQAGGICGWVWEEASDLKLR